MKKTNGKLLELHAREIGGWSDSWRVFNFDTERDDGRIVAHVLTGAIVPLFPLTLRPLWDRRNRSTEEAVRITLDQHESWVQAWEARTGLCRSCLGSGREVEEINRGTYGECRECRGTGSILREAS